MESQEVPFVSDHVGIEGCQEPLNERKQKITIPCMALDHPHVVMQNQDLKLGPLTSRRDIQVDASPLRNAIETMTSFTPAQVKSIKHTSSYM